MGTSKKELLITDVTRMQAPKVCIAGIEISLNSIRPVLGYPGIRENDLFQKGKLIIYPGSVVEFLFVENSTTIMPPHIEDIKFIQNKIRFCKELSHNKFFEYLDKTAFHSINTLFDNKVIENKFVEDISCPRSLGTIKPSKIKQFYIDDYDPQKPKPKLIFVDNDGIEYERPIVDLRIKKLLELNMKKEVREINSKLLSANDLFLRIGLARWFNPNDSVAGFYLQVNGIYSNPDYCEIKLKDLL